MALCVGAHAEIVPATNRVDWVPHGTIGVRGGIPASHHRTNIFLAGGDRTGETNVHELVQSIIDSLSPDADNRWDVYFPTGKFRLGGQLNLKSFIQIVGDSTPTNRTLSELSVGQTNGGWGFALGNYNYAAPHAIVSGSTRGSTNLTLDSSAGLTVGKLVKISCLNPGHYVAGFRVIDYSNYRRIYQQEVVIDAIDGDDVTIWPPLMSDFPLDASPWFEEIGTDDRDVGFANIAISHANEDGHTGNVGSVFLFSGVQRCWWTNVSLLDNLEYGWNVGRSVFMEWQGVYARHRLVEGGANNATIILANDNSSFWVNNSFFENGPPAIEYQRSTFGAFSYNHFTNCISADPYMGNGIHNHGPWCGFVLYEGNDFERAEVNDGYFGSGGPTIALRNRGRGHQAGRTWFFVAYNVGRHTDHFYSIGDILGEAITSIDLWEHDEFNYDPGVPAVVRTRWPNVGNNYTTEETNSAFNWIGESRIADGEQGRPTFVFTLTNSGNGHTIPGVMTNLKAGETLIIKRASNTNLWYPYLDGNTNFAAIEDGTDRVTLTNMIDGGGHAFISWTNGDSVYLAGRDSYGMRLYADIAKIKFHGSFNYYTNGQYWEPDIADHDIPDSYLFASKPTSFWPASLAWPPNDPADPENYDGLPIFNVIRGIAQGEEGASARTPIQRVNLQGVIIQ